VSPRKLAQPDPLAAELSETPVGRAYSAAFVEWIRTCRDDREPVEEKLNTLGALMRLQNGLPVPDQPAIRERAEGLLNLIADVRTIDEWFEQEAA
jgi:hypothetical protein